MERPKRPLLLSTVIFLSVTGSSIAIFIYFPAAIFFDLFISLIEKWTNIQTPQKLVPLYFLIHGALYVLSLIGALNMRNMKKSGYFLYTGAQFTLLVVPLLWMGSHAFSMSNAVFSFLFIGIYSFFLKTFRK